MGGSKSKSEKTSSLTVITPEERQDIHQVFSSISGNQNTLTEPYLEVKFCTYFDKIVNKYSLSQTLSTAYAQPSHLTITARGFAA